MSEYTLGDALNDVLAKSRAEHKLWLQSQVKVDHKMLLANLRWAIEENRRVEAVKSIRHIAGCSLDAAEGIWFAFTTPCSREAAAHYHHLKDDAADYDVAVTSKSNPHDIEEKKAALRIAEHDALYAEFKQRADENE